MIQIIIRKGTKAELNSIFLAQGELGYTIDTKECYIGDGSANLLVGRAMVGLIANRPAAGVSGRIYEATDENKTYLDNGTIWKLVGVASLDDVADGTLYGKVLKTQLNNGQVTTVRAVTAATDVTGDQLSTHLTDDTKHRVINDLGTSTTELWSADKIDTTKADKVDGAVAGNIASLDANGNLVDSNLKRNDAGTGVNDLLSANSIINMINNRLSGLSWKDPSALVLKMVSDASQGGTPPASPNIGDAYIVNNWGGSYVNGEIREWNDTDWTLVDTLAAGDRVLVTASGAAGSFAGQEENIADYNGTNWTFSSPADGWAILIIGDGSIYENQGYTYSGATWTQFTGAGLVNPGIGLSKAGNTLNVNLGAGIAELPTDEIGIDLQPNQGLKLTSVETGGQLAVDYDNSAIGIVGSKLSVLPNGVTSSHLAAAVAGNGLTGGAGSPLAVNVGDGMQILSDAIAAKLKIDGGVIVDTNGLHLSIDGISVVLVNGQLTIGTLNAGTFV